MYVRPHTCMLSCFSHVTLCTVAPQAPLSRGLSRQEHWSGVPFPPPGDLPHPGIEHTSFPSPALTGGFFTDSATWGAQLKHKVKESVGGSVMPDSFQPHGLQPARLLCPWDFPDRNTGVGCHFLLQGIFPTQGSNPGLLHWRQTL